METRVSSLRGLWTGLLILGLAACAQLPELEVTAEAGADQTVTVGTLVTLDARRSSGALSYAWTFESVPQGSAAALEGADTPVLQFTPDLPGSYRLALTVGNGLNEDSDSVTVLASAAAALSVEVDPTLEPTGRVPPLEDGQMRPVATLSANGEQSSSFVSDEVIVTLGDQGRLDAFLDRWNGTLLLTIDPPEEVEADPQYLVRVDTGLPDPAALEADLMTLTPNEGGILTLSSDQGLRLLALAARERVQGLTVDLNWIMEADTFNDRISEEAPGSGGFLNAFGFSYMRSGGLQDVGVTDAWIALERAGKLSNKVNIAIIDGGFAANADFGDNVIATSLVSGDSPLGSANPTECSGGSTCPWHGAGSANAAAGLADNQYGGAGPAGPVVGKLILVHTGLGNAKIRQALTYAANQDAAIISMSFGGKVPAIVAWTLSGYADHVERIAQGRRLFAAAGNAGENIDLGETYDKDPRVYMPCEFKSVICVGALKTNSNERIGYSNYGGMHRASSVYSEGTVDLWAPTNIRVAPAPGSSATWRNFSGTSAATPFAAGVAALVKAANPNESIILPLFQEANTGSPDAEVGRWVNAREAVLRALGEDNPGYLEIVAPTTLNVAEGNPIDFRARVDDLDTDVADYTVYWSYLDHTGTPVTFGNSTSGDTLTATPFCDGSYTVTATGLTSAPSGNAVTDTVTLTVSNASPPPESCAPEVSIVRPQDGATFAFGSTIGFEAVIDDDHPETDDPIHPVIWRAGGASGSILQQPSSLAFSSSKFGTGTHTIYVEYGSASDEITITVQDTPNTPPQATMTPPEADRYFFWDDYDVGGFTVIPFSGSAQDAEDGALTGSALVWAYRRQGAQSWTDFGTGTAAEFRRPIATGQVVYELRLTATDKGGLTIEETTEITIQGPPS